MLNNRNVMNRVGPVRSSPHCSYLVFAYKFTRWCCILCIILLGGLWLTSTKINKLSQEVLRLILFAIFHLNVG